jgi:ankyrin repeat protein
VNAVSESGKTPLHLAAWFEREEVVIELIARGADMNGINNDGKTPLDIARGEVIQNLLLYNGAKTGARAKNEKRKATAQKAWKYVKSWKNAVLGETPLHEAAQNYDLKTIEALLEKGDIDVNVKDSLGRTPLHYIVEKDLSSFGAVALLSRGADVNAKDKDGQTPLHWAVWYNNFNVVMQLIARGAEVNVLSLGRIPLTRTKTPLDMASDKAMKDLLRRNGAKTGEEIRQRDQEAAERARVRGADKDTLNGYDCYDDKPWDDAGKGHEIRI